MHLYPLPRALASHARASANPAPNRSTTSHARRTCAVFQGSNGGDGMSLLLGSSSLFDLRKNRNGFLDGNTNRLKLTMIADVESFISLRINVWVVEKFHCSHVGETNGLTLTPWGKSPSTRPRISDPLSTKAMQVQRNAPKRQARQI